MSKTQVEEINRNVYDIKNKDDYDYKIKKGLTKEIVEEIIIKPNLYPGETVRRME